MFGRVMIRFGILTAISMTAIIALTIISSPFPGRQILYITDPRPDQTATLYIHDLDHGIILPVRHDLLGWGLDAAWSPDGTQIVYSSFYADRTFRGLHIVDVATRETRHIHTGDMDVNSPAWSPDGQYIAYQGVTNPDANWDIYLYDLAKDEHALIYSGFGRDGNPTWSPDGQFLAFEITSNGGQGDIYQYDMETDSLNQLTDHFSTEMFPTWSPDGERLLLISKQDTGNWGVWQLNIVTGEMAQVTDHPGDEYEAAWSPDGAWIVFMSDRSADKVRQIYLMNLTSGETQQVTSGAEGFRQPSFRP